MTRQDLRKIALETMEITEKGYYFKGPRRIDLPKFDYAKTEVFDREKLTYILEDPDEFFLSFNVSPTHTVYIENTDSFEAARDYHRPLVMNFANAHHPGGGFLNGAQAQEEALCRSSTLYKSLISKEAAQMYDYNNAHPNPLDSDYMILSPNVCVFRDKHGNLLDEPYMVSVWTMPAPNKNGMARGVSQEKIDSVMRERLRFFFKAAASNLYSDLVLGAWGCGAFGHDAKTVSGYFKELLIDGLYAEYFDTITFAILDGPDQYKIKAFTDTFGGAAIEYKSYDYHKQCYRQASYPIPVCNHTTTDADEHNIGYAQGILDDGIPFEAELWRDNQNHLNISIYMPLFKNDSISEDYHSDDLDTVSSEMVVSHEVLCIGMAEHDYLPDEGLVREYVEYIVDNGLVRFTTEVYNSSGAYYTDVEGNDIICVRIFLEGDDGEYAKTDLKFRPFPNARKKSFIKIIK